MTASQLKDFLTRRMSMSEVYQPVIIKELLEHGGSCSKEHLAARLADHDASVQEYYQRILMRYPKETLAKHGVVHYDRTTKTFSLSLEAPSKLDEELIQLCDQRIEEWVSKRSRQADAVPSSLRYDVLKAARGKCQLCGIPSTIRSIEVDHIIPKSRADRYGKVHVEGRAIPVNDIENLQALCFRCNRAKRDGDDTDWRRTQKLVRDQIPALMVAEGKSPYVVNVKGTKLKKALRDKLLEEVEEYLESGDSSELADISEVVLALAGLEGISGEQLEVIRKQKRGERGGFDDGLYLKGER